MQPFTTVSGPAAALPAANTDTDVIMPKQFLKGIDRSGLDHGTLHGLRFDANGAPRSDFVLNRPEWAEARFLLVGPNFGCGSSREHAVWGLLQLGIRAIIGTTFAGIFNDNAANNGLLLIAMEPWEVSTLSALAADPARNRLTVDLPAQSISAADGTRFTFEISTLRKDALVRGLDAIGTTLRPSRHDPRLRGTAPCDPALVGPAWPMTDSGRRQSHAFVRCAPRRLIGPHAVVQVLS